MEGQTNNLDVSGSFENIKASLFSVDSVADAENDPDKNFFNDNLQETDSPYFSIDQFIEVSEKLNEEMFSVFHLNIRSLHKNIEKLKNILSFLKGRFSVIVLTETWCDDTAQDNSLFEIPNYTAIHQTRKNDRRGGGICVFLEKTLNFKLRNDLDKCTDDIETLSIEIERKSKNIIISGVYRPPCGNVNTFKNHFKETTLSNALSNKAVFITGDFNINSIDYSTNSTVKNFFNLIFQNSFVPLISRPTRVTRKSATCIDHILTNVFIDSEIQCGILKTDISDHFPIFCLLKSKESNNSSKRTLYKRMINSETIDDFKFLLQNVQWGDVLNNASPNGAYDKFLTKFNELYNIAFPETKIEIKTKNLLSPWITKRLMKSSKRKQKLYE